MFRLFSLVCLLTVGCAATNMLGRPVKLEEHGFAAQDHALSYWQGTPELPNAEQLPVVIFLEGDGSLCQSYSKGLWSRFVTRYTGDYILIRPRTWVNTVCEEQAFREADFDHRVEETIALIDALEPRFPRRRIYLLGHSAGAHIAILVAQRRPESVRGIVNLSGSTQPLSKLLPQIERERARRQSLSAEELSTRLSGLDSLVRQVAQREATTTPFWGRNTRFWQQMFFAPIEPLWKDATHPLLIAHGEKDWESVPFSAVEPLRAEWAHRKNVTFRFYPDLGHDLLRPPVFLDVNRWIQEQER